MLISTTIFRILNGSDGVFPMHFHYLHLFEILFYLLRPACHPALSKLFISTAWICFWVKYIIYLFKLVFLTSFLFGIFKTKTHRKKLNINSSTNTLLTYATLCLACILVWVHNKFLREYVFENEFLEFNATNEFFLSVFVYWWKCD